MMPNDGIIDSPGSRPPANALTSVCQVRYGLWISHFGSSSRVNAGLDAAGAMVKTTSLYVAIAVVTCCDSSLISLVEVEGFKSAIAMAYGYDGSRSCRPSWQRWTPWDWRSHGAVLHSQIAPAFQTTMLGGGHRYATMNVPAQVTLARQQLPQSSRLRCCGGGHNQRSEVTR